MDEEIIDTFFIVLFLNKVTDKRSDIKLLNVFVL